MLKWTTDSKGRRIPDYTAEQRRRIVEAVWQVHFLLPHPDDVGDKEHAASLREFNRALTITPPLKEGT
jgi:hypothetical protein